MHWLTTRFTIDLSRPRLMGIVNVTPDSFSDGGRFLAARDALAHCERLVREGADVLDLGAESSRPGADPLPAETEWARLEPVLLEALKLGVPVSVDTCKPSVMRAVLEAGADMINDIAGFSAQGAVEAVADADCALCLMHMRGEPRTMQDAPAYRDVVEEVRDYLDQGARRLRQAGVAADRIVLDPGFGFGKTAAHNYTLLKELPRVVGRDYPSLLGLSRKSMIGAVTGRPASRRLGGSGSLQRAVRAHDRAPRQDRRAHRVAA